MCRSTYPRSLFSLTFLAGNAETKGDAQNVALAKSGGCPSS